MRRLSSIITCLCLLCLLFTGCGMDAPGFPDARDPASLPVQEQAPLEEPGTGGAAAALEYMGAAIPDWDGTSAWTDLNGGEPWFTDEDLRRTDAFEYYSDLDGLGRCGQAYANVCIELMPTEERGEIGSVRPSGWHTVRYNGLVEGNYLYNRCHLIGFQLVGENANEKNLITGTRYLNIQGMLDLENEIAAYVRETGGCVLYRVTPLFLGDELVCRGLVMEALSIDDGGASVKACRFAWNVQPGVEIDYATGESRRADGLDQSEVEQEAVDGPKRDYVVNLSSGKIHLPDCRHVPDIGEGNRLDVHEGLGKLHAAGYTDCGTCRPGGS